jgi:hypothetical protein
MHTSSGLLDAEMTVAICPDPLYCIALCSFLVLILPVEKQRIEGIVCVVLLCVLIPNCEGNGLLILCVCVCVCMYVCMYVCTYVRMYVCTYVLMYVCTHVRLCVCTSMYVCMYVHMYIYIKACADFFFSIFICYK